ncbi:MAG: polar amino acid transport system permease protein [Gammaproteobacteria bacterium]|jgi:polar amino acid transport system permease protein
MGTQIKNPGVWIMRDQQKSTDLAVMLSVKDKPDDAFNIRLQPWHGLVLLAICLATASTGFAQASVEKISILDTLLGWMPLMLKGFAFNIVISIFAMSIGTVVGTALGLGQISLNPILSKPCWLITQFFRNAPWLVLLFFAMFLLPFEFEIGGFTIPFPDWIKATIGLSLPVMANVSEIVRGAIGSIPTGQWEAAESLAYSRRQTLWLVILPQCIKRMLPPWMNLYSILTMATVLASVVGVSEVMTITGQVLAAEGGRPELLAPFYSFVLLIFFVYCYPIARWTVSLEKKFAVKT